MTDDLDLADDDLDLVADSECLEPETYVEDDATGLWNGDRGTLDQQQRDTLVALLKKEFISSDDRVEWRTLVRDPDAIAANLNNLYFNLKIDSRTEVAFATPARSSDNAFKTLVRDAPNSREETLLLMYLRERFRAATAAGETHVFADATAMYDYVNRMRPDSATDKVADENRVTSAISGLVGSGLLAKTKDEGRYRLHRAIEAVLPLTKLIHLLEAFRARGVEDPIDLRDEGSGGSAGRHAAPDNSQASVDEFNAAAAEALAKSPGDWAGSGDEEST